MQVVLLAVVFLMPLFFAPGAVFHFNTTPKIAILLFSIPCLFVFCKQNVKPLRAPWFTTTGRVFAVLLLAQWTAAGISVLASTTPFLSLDGSLWRGSGWITESALLAFAWFALCWLAGDSARRIPLLRAIAITGVLAAIYGICQYFGRDPFLSPATYQAGEGIFRITRPPGSIGHADYFASWLLMALFPAAALARTEARRSFRIAGRTACVTIAAALLLTGTRAAWLGLAVGLTSLFVIQGFRIAPRSWIVGAASIAALLIFAISPAGVALRARLHWSMDDAGGGARMLLWRDSLRMAAHRPLIGYGLEAFPTQFPRFASLELARAYPDFYQESPHNAFLDVLDSEGVLGAACLAGLIWVGLVSGWRSLRERDPIAGILLAGFIAILVCLQFTVLVPVTELYFYLAVVLLVRLRNAPIADPPATAPVAVAAYWTLAAASLFLPFFAIRLANADRDLFVVKQRLSSGDAVGAALAYSHARQYLPRGDSFDLPYSRAMAELAAASPNFGVRMKAWAEAKEAGVRATSTALDRQNAWYSLAELYAAENNAAGAESSLRNAIALAPNWFKPHWTLANLLALTGRSRDARIEAAAAMERDAGRNPEVAATWKALSAPAP